MGTINARSMKNKQGIIHETIEEYQLNSTLITETWLKNNQDNDIWINSSDLNNGKYNMFIVNRPHHNSGGGITLITTDHLTVKNITQNTSNIEHLTCTVQSGSTFYTVIGIYHPPRQGNTIKNN